MEINKNSLEGIQWTNQITSWLFFVYAHATDFIHSGQFLMMSSDAHLKLLDLCENGTTSEVQRAVELGADPFWQDEKGQNSLIVPIQLRSRDSFQSGRISSRKQRTRRMVVIHRRSMERNRSRRPLCW